MMRCFVRLSSSIALCGLAIGHHTLEAQFSANCQPASSQVDESPLSARGSRPGLPVRAGKQPCTTIGSDVGTFPIFGPKIYAPGSLATGAAIEDFSVNRTAASYGVRLLNLGGTSVSPRPNPAGSNNTNPTITFTCSDSLNLVTCPSPITVTAEGAKQIVSGTANDQAGNAATTSVTINLDKTPPKIVATVTPAPNSAGWNNTPVTVSYNCADSGSGISSCPAPENIASEGTRTLTGTASDLAGNTRSVDLALHIDKTAPKVTITTGTSGSVISAGNLTIAGTATDLVSGIAIVTCQGKPAIRAGTAFTCTVKVAPGLNLIAVQAVDNAGNNALMTVAVQGGIPAILSICPSSSQEGQTNLTVALTGEYTNFAPGVTTANFGVGVTVVSLAVNSARSLTATLNIDPGAPAGRHDVTVTTGSEVVTMAGGFILRLGTPVILSVNPAWAQPGQRVSTTIVGRSTHFVRGVTTADFGPGITVTSLTVNSATSVRVSMNLDWAASTGTRTVTLRTNSETVVAPSDFAIQSPAADPSLQAISVLEFAKCDGSSDDTAGLQAAIRAAMAANQILRVDATGPCVSRTLNIPGDLTLVGPGTIQHNGSSGGPLLSITGNGVTVFGLTLDGHSTGQYGESLVFVESATLLFFENNTLINTVNGEWGLRLVSTTNARVQGNKLSSMVGPPVAVMEGSSYVMVSGNYVDHGAATSGIGGLSAFTAETGLISPVHDVIFSGNTAIESVHFCFEAGNFVSGSTDVSLVYNILFTQNNCTISNTSGINPCSAQNSPAACGGYSFSRMSNSSISGNSYEAAGQVVSIAGIEMTECAGCNAVGNTLTGDTSRIFPLGSEGISINCSGCVVSNNSITNWSPTTFRAGIDIHTVSDPDFQSVDDNTVTGNQIVMPAGSSSTAGIYVNCNNHGGLSPSATRTVITGNTVSGAGVGSGKAILLMQNDPACILDHSVITDNTLSGVTYGIQLYKGTNYEVQNNQIENVSIPVVITGGATLIQPLPTRAGGTRLPIRRTQPAGILEGRMKRAPVTSTGFAAIGLSSHGLPARGSWLSVMSEGAKCDGITDDTVALQAAILHAQSVGKDLRIDGPLPCMSGPLTLAGPVRIFGPGCLKQTGMRNGDFLTATGDGIEIIGIAIDANLVGQSGTVLIYARDASRFVFQGNAVRNTTGGQYALRGINLTDSLVRGNDFASIGGLGIAIDDGSHRVRVEGNRMDHTAAAAGSGSAFSADVTEAVGAPISDIAFVNNSVWESGHYCMASGSRNASTGEPGPASNISFESNHCTLVNTGTEKCIAAYCGGYAMDHQQNATIVGNTYYAADRAVANAGIDVAACESCLIYGNVLQMGVGGAYPRTHGISTNCGQCLIANNTIDVAGAGFGSGIYVYTDPKLLTLADTIVAGNTLRLPAESDSGIQIQCGDAGGSIQRVVILNNTIGGTASGNVILAVGKPGECALDSPILGSNRIVER